MTTIVEREFYMNISCYCNPGLPEKRKAGKTWIKDDWIVNIQEAENCVASKKFTNSSFQSHLFMLRCGENNVLPLLPRNIFPFQSECLSVGGRMVQCAQAPFMNPESCRFSLVQHACKHGVMLDSPHHPTGQELRNQH